MSISKELILTIKGNTYSVAWPNIGNFQRIESLKQVLSNGMYASLMSVPTVSSSEALDMIDMEAFFTVLIPQLIKDLKCNSFGELGIEDYKELHEVYEEKFVPWWSSILELLRPALKTN